MLLSSAQLLAGIFSEKGVVDSFQWSPERYTTGFKYDVLYYIPKKLQSTHNARSLVFMHGGGQSTMTRSGSFSVAKTYIDDLKTLAEELGFIIVAPSGSGLNWGGHTRVMIRDLANFMKEKLKVDADKIGLAGHSMGGMGITRNAHWLVDTFAFFMPMAAGMDPAHATEANLSTYFNTTYHHLQGLKDHFQVFVERCENQTLEVQKLETLFGLKSGFVMEYYNGAHNYVKMLVKSRLDQMYRTKKRDLAQKQLFGMFHWTDRVIEDNKIKFNLYSSDSYFWLNVLKFKKITDQVAYTTSFRANIDDNVIRINFIDTPKIETLRVYLNKELVSFNEPVRIYVNDKIVFDGRAKEIKSMLRKNLKGNGKFNYTSYIDLKL
jgi:hypothetical protein